MKRVVPCLLAVAFFSFGCKTPKSILAESVELYQEGKYTEALHKMTPLLQRTGDESYPLYQLCNGSTLYALGNFYDGAEIFFSGARNLEAELGEKEIAIDLVGSEESIHYRGGVHERVLARYYLGLGYFQSGDYEKASIAFRQALERDINRKKGNETSYPVVHFLLGETYMRMADYENSAVALRNVVQLVPSFHYGWYKLAVALHKLGQLEEAEEAYRRYADTCECSVLLPKDGSGSYIFLVIELGWGPDLRAKWWTAAQFAGYSRVNYPERFVEVMLDGEKFIGRKVEDINAQADAEARMAGDVTRKVFSVAAKTAVGAIPIVGGFLTGSTVADIRKWRLLPGEIHVVLIPASPGPHTLTLTFFDSQNRMLPDYQQSWYYIPAGGEGEARLVYLRSIFQVQNQNLKR